jgi:hypothetical protein
MPPEPATLVNQIAPSDSAVCQVRNELADRVWYFVTLPAMEMRPVLRGPERAVRACRDHERKVAGARKRRLSLRIAPGEKVDALVAAAR